jgi:hypothetical protein
MVDGIIIQPLHEKIVGDVRQALLILLGAVGVVLIIATTWPASCWLERPDVVSWRSAARSAPNEAD